jgi:two-component system cell cycle response regulator DivK
MTVAAANERILIVDDSPQSLKLARVVLAAEGFEVRTAIDAADALRVLESFEPQMVLTDLQLPGVDGLALTRRIRATERFAALVVVALTAYAMKGDEEKALAAGCDAYITKPIDVDTFPSEIRALLASSRPT